MTTLARSTIATREHLELFLKEIHADFLDCVDPWESGLLDQMIADDLVNDADRESLSGKDVRTRRDEARKLWFHLTNLSVSDFASKVFPRLYQEFPHIIPVKFISQNGEIPVIDDTQDKKCLRHSIMRRVRKSTAMDTLFQNGCLTLEDYRSVAMVGGKAEKTWTMLFERCKSKPTLIEDLMKTHGMHMPSNVKELVSDGTTCTCDEKTVLPPATPRSLRRKKVKSWIESSHFDPSQSSSTQRNSMTNSMTSLCPPDDLHSLDSSLSDYKIKLLRPPVEQSFKSERDRGKGQIKQGFLNGGDQSPYVSVTVEGPKAEAELAIPDTLCHEIQNTNLSFRTADAVATTGREADRLLGDVPSSTDDSPQYHPESICENACLCLSTGYAKTKPFFEISCYNIILLMVIMLVLLFAISRSRLLSYGIYEYNEQNFETMKMHFVQQKSS